MKGVFSAAGTFIPGKNMTLSVGTIRGVESHGMLCSEAELLISDDHDGIIELPADAPVGTRLRRMGGLGDPVIEINLTPNRSDCTGVNGIARDLGATYIGDYKENAPKRDRRRVPLPGDGDDRRAGAVPRLRAAPGARRQERPLARLAAEAADGHRPAPHQRAGRYHQLHHLRPRPAAARVRRRQGEGKPHRPPRRRTASNCWRSTGAPTRSTRASASSPTRRASSRCPASWAARNPAATRTPPTC